MSKPWHNLASSFVLAACASLGCSSSAEEATAPRAALVHREAALACSGTRPAGDYVPGHAGCQSDAECTAGLNGRCSNGGVGGNGCTYDGCVTDAECGATEACVCRGQNQMARNSCKPASCHVDADCGGWSCSPTKGTCDLTGVEGFYCHGQADECVDDADCPKAGGTSERAYCMWTESKGRWACHVTNCMN